MPTAPTPPLLAALRAGTRDLHDRTEAAFVLGGPVVTRAVYADVLARLASYYVRAEAALAPWAPPLAAVGLDLAARQKAPLLHRDLDVLGAGGATPGGMVAALDAVVEFHVSSAAHALGVAYVLEGATLGGQILRRRLGPALGLTPEAGLAFFGAYGADVGSMWRAFTAAVERFDAATPPDGRPVAHAAAVATARATFLAFERDVVSPTAAPTFRRVPGPVPGLLPAHAAG